MRIDLETQTVSMPLSYWLKIAEYAADTETNIEILSKMK